MHLAWKLCLHGRLLLHLCYKQIVHPIFQSIWIFSSLSMPSGSGLVQYFYACFLRRYRTTKTITNTRTAVPTTAPTIAPTGTPGDGFWVGIFSQTRLELFQTQPSRHWQYSVNMQLVKEQTGYDYDQLTIITHFDNPGNVIVLLLYRKYSQFLFGLDTIILVFRGDFISYQRVRDEGSLGLEISKASLFYKPARFIKALSYQQYELFVIKRLQSKQQTSAKSATNTFKQYVLVQQELLAVQEMVQFSKTVELNLATQLQPPKSDPSAYNTISILELPLQVTYPPIDWPGFICTLYM